MPRFCHEAAICPNIHPWNCLFTCIYSKLSSRIGHWGLTVSFMDSHSFKHHWDLLVLFLRGFNSSPNLFLPDVYDEIESVNWREEKKNNILAKNGNTFSKFPSEFHVLQDGTTLATWCFSGHFPLDGKIWTGNITINGFWSTHVKTYVKTMVGTVRIFPTKPTERSWLRMSSLRRTRIAPTDSVWRWVGGNSWNETGIPIQQ